MQFLAYYSPLSSLYLGAHDPKGRVKTLEAMVVAGSPSTGLFRLGYFPSAMGSTAVSTYNPGFLTAIGLIQPAADSQQTDTGVDWYDAAQVYRTWAIKSAEWTQQGSLEQRNRPPAWFVGTPLWFNTGWQPVDVFNTTQGDPDVVVEEMRTIRQLFPTVPLALHWLVKHIIDFEQDKQRGKDTFCFFLGLIWHLL